MLFHVVRAMLKCDVTCELQTCHGCTRAVWSLKLQVELETLESVVIHLQMLEVLSLSEPCGYTLLSRKEGPLCMPNEAVVRCSTSLCMLQLRCRCIVPSCPSRPVVVFVPISSSYAFILVNIARSR